MRRHPICVCTGFKDFLPIILPFPKITILIYPLFSKSGKWEGGPGRKEKDMY